MRIRPTPADPDVDRGRRRSLQLAGAGTLSVLVGCGGGESSPPPTVAPSAVDRPRQRILGGVDSGGTGSPEAAFFSAAMSSAAPMTLAGVAFDTAAAVITDGDGGALSITELAIGMTAQVHALWSASAPGQAQALSVQCGEHLRGPLQQTDVLAGRFTVLGQRVRCTSTTQFEPVLGGLATLPGDRWLRVWGTLDVASGEVVATRIGSAETSSACIVRGVLTRLDAVAGELTIGALTLQAEAPAGCAVGDVVRARLMLQPDGRLAVQELRRDALVLPSSGAAEIEGRVTTVLSTTLFAIDGVPVDASKAVWSGPMPTVGAKAAAAGRADHGVLRASEASVEVEELFELEGAIGRVDSGGRSFDLRGVLVTWDASTRFEGGDARLLTPRRKVAVKGRVSRDRLRLQAVRIHIEA